MPTRCPLEILDGLGKLGLPQHVVHDMCMLHVHCCAFALLGFPAKKERGGVQARQAGSGSFFQSVSHHPFLLHRDFLPTSQLFRGWRLAPDGHHHLGRKEIAGAVDVASRVRASLPLPSGASLVAPFRDLAALGVVLGRSKVRSMCWHDIHMK